MLRAALKSALKDAGMKKKKKKKKKKERQSGSGSSKERRKSDVSEVPLLLAARIGGIVRDLQQLEYGDRIAGGILQSYGSDEKQEVW